MSAGAEVTSTCELTVPTRKTGLMSLTCPSAVAMSLTTVVSKPCLVTVTRKMPSGNCGKLNCPLASLVSVRSCPVEGFTSLTVCARYRGPLGILDGTGDSAREKLGRGSERASENQK